jgi:hypothetical protein
MARSTPKRNSTKEKKVATASKPIETPVIVESFQYEPNCRQCGELLPTFLMALGICGDCLVASQQAVRTIPRPGYQGE